MVRLRPEQQKEIAVALFLERLTRHWTTNFPMRFDGISDCIINELAVMALARAQERHLEDEDEIALWADLCLVNQLDFASRLNAPGH